MCGGEDVHEEEQDHGADSEDHENLLCSESGKGTFCIENVPLLKVIAIFLITTFSLPLCRYF